MIESNIVSACYGALITIIIMKWVYARSDKGRARGECPYCKETVDVWYETMYECPNCKKRYTDEEAHEQSYLNEQEYEQEKEREFQRLHNEQRKQEYNEKLKDLRDEYNDIRK